LECPTVPIHADNARPGQFESPGSTGSARAATKIEYSYVRRNTGFKVPDNLTYEKEMERREVHRECGSLSSTAESRSRIDAVPALDIYRRKSLDGPPDLWKVQIGQVAPFERIKPMNKRIILHV